MRVLPVLSGKLRDILKAAKNDYPEDPIVKEILRVDRIVEFYLKNESVLEEVKDIIYDEIKNSIKDEVIMLSGRFGEEFEVSFLPADKEPEYNSNGEWARRNRQTGKPGRIFQKLLKKEFKQVEWEVFVNRFKASMCCSTNFEIVSGEEITYWYNSEHYFACQGTLGNSCMKYNECESYFKLYEDKAQMLISRKNGLLTGRALVWKINDKVTILDRIYTCYDYLENCFRDYAKKNGWWIRNNNSLLNNGDEQGWYSPDDNYESVRYDEFRIHLDHRYDYFPYVDSFRYYNGEDCLSTHPIFQITLSNTDGSYDGSYRWCCDRCGEVFYSDYEDDVPDGLHYSEHDGYYYCDDCCWWCEYLEDYISNSIDQYILHLDYGTTFDVPMFAIEDIDTVCINGEYYIDDGTFEFRTNSITGDKELVK